MIRYKEIIAEMITTTINAVVRNFSVAEIHEITFLNNTTPIAKCMWNKDKIKGKKGFTVLRLYKGSEAMCYFYTQQHELMPTEVLLNGVDTDGTVFHLESRLNAFVSSAA